VRVTAICESNPKTIASLGEAGGGNVAGAAERIDLAGLQGFHDLDAPLASGAVDALSITPPTVLHPAAAARALGAGPHALREKPMALTVADCDRMIAAAKKAGRALQVGHCVRFWPEYAVTAELVRSGRYGRPIAASFRRFTALPGWSPDSWFADESRSGGQP